MNTSNEIIPIDILKNSICRAVISVTALLLLFLKELHFHVCIRNFVQYIIVMLFTFCVLPPFYHLYEYFFLVYFLLAVCMYLYGLLSPLYSISLLGLVTVCGSIDPVPGRSLKFHLILHLKAKKDRRKKPSELRNDGGYQKC